MNPPSSRSRAPAFSGSSRATAVNGVGLGQHQMQFATGAALTLLYVLIAYGRIAETLLPIPFIAFFIGGLTLAVALATGTLVHAAKSRAGILFLLLTALLIIGIPFSEWPGGSLNLVIRKTWLKSVAVFFMIAGTITTITYYRRLMYTIGAAVMLIALTTQMFAGESGRFALEAGTLSNPNDLAIHVLMGIPFLLFIVEAKTLKSVFAWLAIALMGVTLIVVLKTGSRAGLLTLAVLLLYVFIRGSGFMKVALVAAGIAGIAVIPAVISPEARDRYLALLDADSVRYAATREGEHAAASAEARKLYLYQSLEIMLSKPLLGVGPGMFSIFTAAEMQAEGVRAHWHQAHNSFTQMASEAGIPAGMIYTALLVFAIRTRGRVRKLLLPARPGPVILTRDQEELLLASKAVTCSAITFAVGAFFGNYAYMFYVPMLAGCAQSIRMIAVRYTPVMDKPAATGAPPSSARRPAFPAVPAHRQPA
jgi:O-antigen ligase